MSDSPGAIVIGASVAGLLAARALIERAKTVLILDRDDLPAAAATRRCVGQGGQVHMLLDSGRKVVEELLPGIFDEIAKDGGLTFDFGASIAWYHAGDFKVRVANGIEAHVQTRPLLEHHIRRRVEAVEGITVRCGARVTGLRVENGRVRGVTIAGPEGDEVIEAPIVIDAGGRGANGVKWLEAAGYRAPPTTEIEVGLGYASRMYRRPASAPSDTHVFLTYGDRKRTTRHGLLFDIEGDRWHVSLMGYHGDHPPADAAGFEAWVKTLEHPQLAELLAHAEPLSDVKVFTVPKQIRRHFQRVDLPEGFAVVGDAACALDPVFGQGMSVAAVTAAAIHKHLARHPFGSRAIQRLVSKAADRAWLVTTIEAMRYAQARRIPGVGLVHAFLDRIARVSARDAVVYHAFVRVLHLHEGVAHMLRPDRLWRILRPKPGADRALRALRGEREHDERLRARRSSGSARLTFHKHPLI